jgi:hypothetical protein
MLFSYFCHSGIKAGTGFKLINLDCMIGRRGMTIQLHPSSLAKLIILEPVRPVDCPGAAAKKRDNDEVI